MNTVDIAIKVENLSKCHQIYDSSRERLKQFVAPRLHRLIWQSSKQYFLEFRTLKDFSFEIKKSKTVGIIGRNGRDSIQTNGLLTRLVAFKFQRELNK